MSCCLTDRSLVEPRQERERAESCCVATSSKGAPRHSSQSILRALKSRGGLLSRRQGRSSSTDGASEEDGQPDSPLGSKLKAYFFLFSPVPTMTVWPALLPPAQRAQMSAS